MLTFLAAALVVIVTPGPDFALVTRNVLASGRRGGFATLAGLVSGVSVHVTAAVLGVSALLATSATAFTVLKVAGGAYLLVLGVLAVRDARRRRTEPAAERPPAERAELGACWRQGFLSNALNPKVALFFLTFVPQFVEPGPGASLRTVAVSLLFVAMAASYLAVYILLLSRMQRFLRRPTVQRRLETLSGAALAGLGGRLLVASGT